MLNDHVLKSPFKHSSHHVIYLEVALMHQYLLNCLIELVLYQEGFFQIQSFLTNKGGVFVF